MAQLILDIPDPIYDRVVSNVSQAYAYDPNSGVDAATFIQQTFLNQMFAIVKSQEADAAAEVARQNQEALTDQEVVLTVMTLPMKPQPAQPAQPVGP